MLEIDLYPCHSLRSMTHKPDFHKKWTESPKIVQFCSTSPIKIVSILDRVVLGSLLLSNSIPKLGVGNGALDQIIFSIQMQIVCSNLGGMFRGLKA